MGLKKGTATIIANRPTSPTAAQVEFEVRYTDPENSILFFLDQQFVNVDLSDNISSINNAVQVAAQGLINNEVGANTITDKNDIRLTAGLVS